MSYLETVDTGMKKLEDLINKFLEFARLDLRFLTPLPSAIQVEQECQEIIVSLLPVAEAKKIELTAEFPQEIIVLQADPLLFRRVLENLLRNAIKFAPLCFSRSRETIGRCGLPSKTRGPVSLHKTCLISSRSFTGGRVLEKIRGSAWDWPQSSGSSTPMAAASG